MTMKILKTAFCTMLAAASIGLFTGCQPGPEPQVEPEPAHVIIHSNFHSNYVPARTIRVWVPKGYSEAQQYDVLYMHDGKMLFDASITWNHQEWGVDEAMDSLVNSGAIRPTIVVGIDNIDNGTGRVGEYCPDDITEFLDEGHAIYPTIAAKGNDYLRFVVEEVKPFIDSTYSTYRDRSHTWTMGSSCGGLISSYALCKYPDVFGGAACMSTHCILVDPNVNTADMAVIEAYRLYLQKYLKPNSALLYMDDGDQTIDAYYTQTQAAINDMLRAQNWDEAHFMYRFFPGHAHEERYWRARLDIPLRFLLAH